MSFFDDASLAFLPSGGAGKDGKAYSIKPTDGTGDFTFSRGSNLAATRVGPTGLIEKGRENLLLRSNDFNTTWATTNSSVTSGQSGYDGSSDAWLVSNSATNGYIQQSISLSSSVYTFSVYVKKGSGADTTFRMRVQGAANNTIEADIVSGTMNFNVGNIISSSVDDIGGGWFRVKYSLNDSVSYVRIDNRGDDTNTIYIQDAQLEIGLAATDYIESGATTGKAGLLEDEPRFDYSGGATCPSLLLEPSRTNLVGYSEYFDGLNKIGIAITTNETTSPEGIQNAHKITGNGSSGDHQLYTQPISFTSGTSYTISVFAKADTNDFIQFVTHGGTFSNTAWANFDLSNGTTGTIGSDATASIENYGNGWYRCILTATATATLSSNVSLFMITSATSARGESNTLSTSSFLYGFQVEASSYPTSYIPNHSGGSVTRGADDCTNTSASSLIGQTEGTLFIKCEYPRTAATSARKLMSVNDGTSVNLVDMFVTGANTLNVRVRANSAGFGSIGISNTPTGIVKIAYAYKANDYVLYINGTQFGSVTSGGSFTFSSALDIIQIGDGEASGDELGGDASQALLFDTRLSNADLETLTTL